MKNIYTADLLCALILESNYEKSIPSSDLVLLSKLQKYLLLSEIFFTWGKMKLNQGGRMTFKRVLAVD